MGKDVKGSGNGVFECTKEVCLFCSWGYSKKELKICGPFYQKIASY
jgi:hypothetical protein